MAADQLSEALGASIRRHRLAVGLSQAALAEALSLSRTSVTNIECGRQPLSVSSLYEVARVVGVAAAELLPEDTDRPNARGRRSKGVKSLIGLLDPAEDASAT